MIVVDASVLANALADDEESGRRARARLAGDPDLHAPELVDLEVLSVLRRRLLHGDLGEERAATALLDLGDLALERYPHRALTGRAWQLRTNMTPYDASYVALAEALGCALVTADGPLARAPGSRCPVELLA